METFALSSEYLVRQKKEMIEILAGWEANNRYEIYTIDPNDGQRNIVGYALEDTDCCSRMMCGPARAFNIKFVHANDNRPFMALNSGVDCCGRSTQVEIPEGVHFGSVEKPFACCRPNFNLKDASGKTQFRIRSPWGAVCCKACADVRVKVKSASSGQTVAVITKQWKGIFKEAFTDADSFGVRFEDPNLTPADRALIMAAVFPVDFAFFERSNDNN